MNGIAATDRAFSVRLALRLEWLTIGWNVIEGVVAITAVVLAGSVALLGFGIDSFVECASGAVLVRRLLAERRGLGAEEVERLDGSGRLNGKVRPFATAIGLPSISRSFSGKSRPVPTSL